MTDKPNTANVAKALDPWDAFERDVPEPLREEAITAMAEATSGFGKPANVTILEHDRIDAINARASGVIEIDGIEYTFQMEDGNRNGTELLAWESDRPFERHEPTRWALQPSAAIVDRHIAKGLGPFLIQKWDALAKRPEVADIIRSYSYDRYVQPGGKIEGHYRDKAARYDFEIVTADTAASTRARLEIATEAYPHD